MRVGLVVTATLVAALVALALSTALETTRPVGFQRVEAADHGGRPLEVSVWYPTDTSPRPTTLLGLRLMAVAPGGQVTGNRLPLVVISHGNGGGPGSHADLALALAENGFVVAAPTHTGDNYGDQSSAGSSHWLTDRTQHVHSVVEYMLKVWPSHGRIDANRIGIFGFSAGGFTALTAIGGEPDLRAIATHCSDAPEFVCQLLLAGGSPLLRPEGAPAPSSFVRESRIKAAVVAAPGLSFTFVPDGLSRVAVPVQLWSGEADEYVPYSSNTGPVRRALGSKVEFHAVPGANHFSFLVPCRLVGPPMLCRDADGFDRTTFHSRMNALVVAFFQKSL
jgi:predicted dienelactone hydrolase